MNGIFFLGVLALALFSNSRTRTRTRTRTRARRNELDRGYGPSRDRVPVHTDEELQRQADMERGLQQLPIQRPQPVQQHELQPVQQHELQPVQQHELQPVQQHELQPVENVIAPIAVPHDDSDAHTAALSLLAYVANTAVASRNRAHVVELQQRMGGITTDGLVGPQTNRRVHELTGMWIPGVRR